MNEWDKKRKKSMICLTPKPNQSFFVCCIQSKEKEIFKEKGEWRIEQKTKRRLFKCSRYGHQEGPFNINKKAR